MMGVAMRGTGEYYGSMGVIALGNILNSLSSRLDLISVLIGDLDRELFLDGHHDFDGIQ